MNQRKLKKKLSIIFHDRDEIPHRKGMYCIYILS